MKVLILGSGSFAGQALFSEYLKRDIDIFGINRSKPKDKYQWPWVDKYYEQINKRWFTYSLTLSLNEMIDKIKILNPEVIVDFMGQGMVAQSWKNPELWYRTNISNKAKLLNSLLNIKNLKKYIRISTPEVYGSNSNYVNESKSFNPSTPYAVSHTAIDMHLRCLYKQYGFPFLIGRFANFYGIGQQLYRIVPRIFLSCKTNLPFILDGKGESKRSFIYTNDFITAIDKLCQYKGVGEEFNFSSNEEVSILSLFERICYLTDTDKNDILNFGPERPGKDMFYRLDISKSKNILNWEPHFFLNQGLSEVNNWINKNHKELSEMSWEYLHKD